MPRYEIFSGTQIYCRYKYSYGVNSDVLERLLVRIREISDSLDFSLQNIGANKQQILNSLQEISMESVIQSYFLL